MPEPHAHFVSGSGLFEESIVDVPDVQVVPDIQVVPNAQRVEVMLGVWLYDMHISLTSGPAQGEFFPLFSIKSPQAAPVSSSSSSTRYLGSRKVSILFARTKSEFSKDVFNLPMPSFNCAAAL